MSTSKSRCLRGTALAVMVSMGVLVSGCTTMAPLSRDVSPVVGSPVTDNKTPYTVCLSALGAHPRANRPTLAIGQIMDKTGRRAFDNVNESSELTQGVSEMLISAFFKTKQVNLAERIDARIALAEQQLIDQKLIRNRIGPVDVAPAHFLILGALTELNYNIASGGARLYVAGIGGSRRTAVINVGLDLRVVDMRTLATVYVTSLQKQIRGFEHEAGVYRFFENQFVDFDAGEVRNEPLQLGVRSVAELAVYQILTEGLGLPAREHWGCQPGGEFPRE